MATVAKCIRRLSSDADIRWPGRSKPPYGDGTLGDASHQARKSDHNDGNAIDINATGAAKPDDGKTPNGDELAEALLLDRRSRYVIWNKRIKSNDPGLRAQGWRPYTGASPHDHHVHLSIYAQYRDDDSPWQLSGTTSLYDDEPTDPELEGLKSDTKTLVVFAFGAGGAYALLRWLIGVAAVVCLSSCAAFQQADKFLGEAATAVSLAEPRLQVCYAAELESCKKDNTCEITEEVWKPVIDSFKAVRKTWCAILPGALGCIEE